MSRSPPLELYLSALAFSPDGTRLACAGWVTRDNVGRCAAAGVYDLLTWAPVWVRIDDDVRTDFASAAFSPDGSSVALGAGEFGPEAKVSLCDAATGEVIRRLGMSAEQASSLAISPDGRTLYAALGVDVVALAVESGDVVWSRRSQMHLRHRIALSADGRCVASWGDGTAVVRDGATGELVAVFKGHSTNIEAVALSDDGRRIATASASAIRVREIVSRDDIAHFAEPASPHLVAFREAGEALASLSWSIQLPVGSESIFLRRLTLPDIPPGRRETSYPPTRNDYGLYAAILAEPDDGALRLVYADFLEESGDAARAEFVRVQCRMDDLGFRHGDPEFHALANRAWELRSANEERWTSHLGPLREVIDHFDFRGGLLSGVRMSGVGVNDDHMKTLAAVAPEIESLGVDSSAITPAGLAHLAGLPCLRSLNLTGTDITAADLHRLHPARRLVGVIHYGWPDGPDPELEAFKATRNAFFLSLPPEARRREAVRAVGVLEPTHFVPGGEFPSLSFVSPNRVSDADLVYLSALPELRELRFEGIPAVTSVGLRHLRGLTELCVLGLDFTNVTSLEPLAGLVALEELNLSRSSCVDSAQLRHLRPMTRLRRLDLMGMVLDEDAVGHLLALPALEELIVGEDGYRVAWRVRDLRPGLDVNWVDY